MLRKICFVSTAAMVLVCAWPDPARSVPIPGGTLDPTNVIKYAAPLVIPPAMPPTATQGNRTYYEIAVRQFQQQILPTNYNKTTVWSYGSRNHAGTFNYPAFTIEATVAQPVRVKWINDLKDAVFGNYLPHLLTVDPTLHWANPPHSHNPHDTPVPYTGPVPIITHVHGAHVGPESDGYPEAWWLPAASNIPAGYLAQGARYDQYDRSNTEPGTAVFQYPNDQRATTLWYHDHTLGMTRLNVYAGPAGFYLLRGGADAGIEAQLPGPAPQLGDAAGTTYYEIPIAVQDRSFNADGSLFYPTNRAFFDGFDGPFIPVSDMSPYWNPEFFGNAMVVNGVSWPALDVEPRRYRFRFLNGCNARFLILKIVADPLATRPAPAALNFWQIGNEGGFLPAALNLDQLLMAPAERADVIVDFSGLASGTELYIINEGPDEPFGGGTVGVDFAASDPETTGQVMKFRVAPLASTDTSTPPNQLTLRPVAPLETAQRTRQLSLNEMMSEVLPDVGPRMALLGVLDSNDLPAPKRWSEAITELPHLNDTEIWEFHNFTEDAHPIHLHMVMFEVVNRQNMTSGIVRAPESWETGRKDTVIAYPGEITRIKAYFDIAGLYVWHCHIVEHEDNEMMRPYRVLGKKKRDFDADGKEDFAVYHQPSGAWRISLSSQGYNPLALLNDGVRQLSGTFGGPACTAVEADFNGDRKADPAVYDESNGIWSTLLSAPDGSYVLSTTNLGILASNPSSGDFDNDGDSDPLLYDPATGIWRIVSADEKISFALGGPYQMVATEDFDGDELDDPTAYDPATGLWTTMLSGNGYTQRSLMFGGAGAEPEPEDYDGDRKADPAIYQESSGLWMVMLSGSSYASGAISFGGPGWNPQPEDYDGDRKADPAIYQESSGLWMVMLSGSGYVPVAANFGGPGWTPVR